MKTALAAAVSTKLIAGAAVAAAATGGIALAASQGALHSNGHAHSSTPTTSVSTDVSATATPTATPSPNMVGLCTAYEAGVKSSSGKALDNPAFSALASAASTAGAADVDTYCVTVLATAPSAGHVTGKPTDLPTQATEHPGGKPTSLPTQADSHAVGDRSGASSTHP